MGGTGSILMLNGAPSDPNAAQFKAGAHSVLDGSRDDPRGVRQPRLEPGERAVLDHRPAQQVRPADTIQGVYAANDGQAGGVVAALTGAGVAADALPPITGQDAEIAAIQRIVAGEQAMTVYKPIPIEAETAAEVAVDLPTATRSATPSDTGIAQTDLQRRRVVHLRPGRRHAGQRGRHDHRRRVLRRRRHLHREYADACAGGRHQLMTTTQTMEPPVRGEAVLSLTGITKRFGAVQALTDVHLDVRGRRGRRPGRRQRRRQVHARQGDRRASTSPTQGRSPSSEAVRCRSPAPRPPSTLGIATVFQDLALCDNLDVVANLFLGQERPAGPFIDEVGMEKEAWRLLRTLSAKIPSVRIPIASLSGGQRQTVAIARSLVGAAPRS